GHASAGAGSSSRRQGAESAVHDRRGRRGKGTLAESCRPDGLSFFAGRRNSEREKCVLAIGVGRTGGATHGGADSIRIDRPGTYDIQRRGDKPVPETSGRARCRVGVAAAEAIRG